jgi:hypothetical protein
MKTGVEIMGLSHLGDQQLMDLFTESLRSVSRKQIEAILIELMRRGYFFDVHQREFVTSAEWRVRYQEAPPANFLGRLRRPLSKLL